MKNRQKANSFAGYKYLLFVPLAFALVFMASCKRKTKVQEQVMEGTKVEVKVVYNGKNMFPGHFKKTITIRTNGVTEMTRIYVEGVMEEAK